MSGILTRISCLLLFVFVANKLVAQELNATVVVAFDKVKAQATNPRIFETLERSAQEFLNNTKWTNDNFELEERIACSFLITIDKIGGNSYEASIQVSSNRPVFNSNYTSSLINHKDNEFTFDYVENSPIIYTQNQYRDNLSSVLAYYANIVLAMDYDSFSREGGKPYYVEAQRIVANAQNSGQKGWTSSGGTRNRFWLVDNALQEAFEPLRNCFYEYHRQGMDKMYVDPVEARKVILKSLESLRAIHSVEPLSFNVQLWFTAKYQEIVNIFKEATPEEKEKVLTLVSTLDPSNISNYQKIKG